MVVSRLSKAFQRSALLAFETQRVLTLTPYLRTMASSSPTLNPSDLYAGLQKIGVGFYCGVPDSLLKDFCAYVTSNASLDSHVITANEGCAVSLAAGYHLATGGHALVYLQNSGLGNTVNPIMSLAAAGVYQIPMLLLIGWRGEPGVKDEPQHVTQGRVTPSILDVMGVASQVLPQDKEMLEKVLNEALQHLSEKKTPYCLLVKNGTFSSYKLTSAADSRLTLSREQALTAVVDSLSDKDIIVSSTGMLSRELFEHRATRQQAHSHDFLTVGSMGHASSIALAIALRKPQRQVFCLDGDGAVIMHMGALATVGQLAPANFKHIIFNNGAHDSVGGQPTAARHWDTLSLPGIAKACGYKEATTAMTEAEVKTTMTSLHEGQGPILLEIRTKLGARSDLGRPTRTPLQNKADFMEFVAADL